MAVPNTTYAPLGTNVTSAAAYYDGAAIVVNTPFPVCKGIYIGGAGNLTVTLVSGSSVTFTAPPVGTILPVAATNVSAATATLMVALY